MVVAVAGQGLALPAGEQVAVVHHYAAVAKAAVGPLAHGITQFMVCNGGIDQIVAPPDLSDGACLKELMPLEAGTGGFSQKGKQFSGSGPDGQHIVAERHDDRRLRLFADLLFRTGTVAGIDVDLSVIINEHARIEGNRITAALAQNTAVRVLHKTIELIMGWMFSFKSLFAKRRQVICVSPTA